MKVEVGSLKEKCSLQAVENIPSPMKTEWILQRESHSPSTQTFWIVAQNPTQAIHSWTFIPFQTQMIYSYSQPLKDFIEHQLYARP